VVIAIGQFMVDHGAENAVRGGQGRLGHTADGAMARVQIGHEVGDIQQRETVPRGEGLQRLAP